MSKFQLSLRLGFTVYGTYALPDTQASLDFFRITFLKDLHVKKKYLPYCLHANALQVGPLALLKQEGPYTGSIVFDTNTKEFSMNVLLNKINEHFDPHELVQIDAGYILKFNEGSVSHQELLDGMRGLGWSLVDVIKAPMATDVRESLMKYVEKAQDYENTIVEVVVGKKRISYLGHITSVKEGYVEFMVQHDDDTYFIEWDEESFFKEFTLTKYNSRHRAMSKKEWEKVVATRSNPHKGRYIEVRVTKKGTEIIYSGTVMNYTDSTVSFDLSIDDVLYSYEMDVASFNGTFDLTSAGEYITSMKAKDWINFANNYEWKDQPKRVPYVNEKVTVTLNQGSESYVMTGTVSKLSEVDSFITLTVQNLGSPSGKQYTLMLTQLAFQENFKWEDGIWTTSLEDSLFEDVFDESAEAVLDVLWPVIELEPAKPFKKKTKKKAKIQPEVGQVIVLDCTLDDETWYTVRGIINSIHAEESTVTLFLNHATNKNVSIPAHISFAWLRKFIFDTITKTWTHQVDQQEYKDIFGEELKKDLETLGYINVKTKKKKKKIKSVQYSLTVGTKNPFLLTGHADIVSEFGHIKIFYDTELDGEDYIGTKIIPMELWESLFTKYSDGVYGATMPKKTFERLSAE